MLRYDPMSMRPFMSYPEGAYAAHWLAIIGAAAVQPIFAHVNWFQRDPGDGHFLWPGYRDNLRPLLWLLRLKDGEVQGNQTPVGIVPTKEELDLDGVDITPADLDKVLSHRFRALAARDGTSRAAPVPVRRPAGGDLGGAPSRRRCAGRAGCREPDRGSPDRVLNRPRQPPRRGCSVGGVAFGHRDVNVPLWGHCVALMVPCCGWSRSAAGIRPASHMRSRSIWLEIRCRSRPSASAAAISCPS